MSTYQITFITSEEKNDSVKKTVESFDGKIVKEDYIGRKKFAYPIKKEGAGYYSNLVFNIDHKKLLELEKKLRLDEKILRYLLINKEMEKKVTKKKEKREIEEKEAKLKKQSKPPVETLKVAKPAEKLRKEEEKKTSSETPVSIAKPEPVIEEIEEKTAVKPLIKQKPSEKEKISELFTKPKEEVASEDERLKILEEKLDELLKE